MQHAKFHDGSFVLHKVVVNGHKYSVWFDNFGKPKAAERVKPNGNTVNVSEKCVNLYAEFERIGKENAPGSSKS